MKLREGSTVKGYSIGDKLVYGLQGVVQIVDIRKEKITDTEKEYYILSELDSHSSSYTYVPMDNERLVAAMRPLMSVDEAKTLIKSISSIPELEWKKDSRARNEEFRSIMESGNRERLISMIKTIRKVGEERLAQGKKNYLSDEHAMQKAQRLINSELALVLNIPLCDVPSFVKENMQ